jgi:hypothetical protein
VFNAVLLFPLTALCLFFCLVFVNGISLFHKLIVPYVGEKSNSLSQFGIEIVFQISDDLVEVSVYVLG